MNTFKTLRNIGNQKFYHKDNAEKSFVSIDLKKANFQAFRFFNPNIIDSHSSYEDFVKTVINDSYDYFYQSKQIRQVIFGNLNPKRQQKIQKYLMSVILDVLMKSGMDSDAVFNNSADELIVSDNSEKIILGKGISKSDIVNTLKLHEITNSLDLHIEDFCLEQVHPDFSFFVKNNSNGKKEFKNVPSYNMAEVFKYYNNIEVIEKDLSFFYEGRIASFKNKIFP
jgi:hypothetical protein